MIKPDYEGGCIVNLMSSLRQGLGDHSCPYKPARQLLAEEIAQADRVMLLVIDGLGDALLRHSSAGATLRRYRRGRLTSVFPSTTATAITTYLTGEAPQQHGITGWFTYFGELDEVITVLPFVRRQCYDGTRKVPTTPRELLGHTPVFDRLSVTSHSLVPAYIAGSQFNVDHSGGAELHPFDDLAALFTRAEDILFDAPGPLFLHAYWPMVDTLSHEHGPSSTVVADHLDDVDRWLAYFLRQIQGYNTLVLVCADHGLIDTTEDDTVRLEDHPALARTLSQPVCGEPRASFCYVKPERESEFLAYIRSHLTDAIEPYPSRRLVDEGWYGPGPAHPRLLDRVGHYTLIPKHRHTFKDLLPGEEPNRHLGVHGGVSEQEMYVPLIAACI